MPVTKNTERQPACAAIQKSSGESSAEPTYCPLAYVDVARPRSRCGNQVDTTRLLTGKAGASARPTAKRRPNSAANPLTTPRRERRDRPSELRDAVDGARAEAVDEVAAGQIRDRVAPRERGEEQAHLHRVEAELLRQEGCDDREVRAIDVVDRRRDEEQREHRERARASAAPTQPAR